MRAWLVLAMLVSAGRSNAAPSVIEDDAALVMRASAPVLFEVVNLSAELGPEIGAAVSLVRTLGSSAVGHDLLSATGFEAAGFDSKGTVWMQLGALDRKRADAVFRHLGAAEDWTPSVLRKADKVMWRSRLVLPVRDERKVKKSLSRLHSLVPSLLAVDGDHEEELAALLGARPKRGPDILRELRRKRVLAILWVDGVDSYVVVRMRERLLVIDVVGSFAGVPVVWVRDRRKLLGSLPDIRRKGGLASGTHHAMPPESEDGLHLWVSHAGLRSALHGLAATSELRAIAATLPQGKTAQRAFQSRSLGTCAELDTLAQTGAITDMSLSLLRRPSALEVRGRWGLRGGGRWLTALLAPAPAPVDVTAGGTLIAGHAYLSDVLRASKLPRPPSLERGFSVGLLGLTRCPGGSFSGLVALAWPELASGFVTELARVDDTARQLLSSGAQLTVAVRALSVPGPRAELVLSADAGSGAPLTPELFENVFGPGREAAGGTVRWGTGPMIGFARQGSARAGFAIGSGVLDWFLALPKARTAPRSGIAAQGSADLATLAARLFGRAAVDGLERHVAGRAAVEVEVSSSHVDARITVPWK